MTTTEVRTLPVESNATVRTLSPTKTEVRFPKDGFLRVGRSQFHDDDDVRAYLTQALPAFREEESGLRWTIKRVGKYQRMNEADEPVFTFGDLAVDLITDQFGFSTIAGQIVNMRQLEKSQAPGPGGIRSTDLAPLAGLAPPPSDLTFVDPSGGSAVMKFHAWKKNHYVHWSIGAEIETWGHDFTYAQIDSRYGHYELGADVCSLVKTDSDHDTNDDYVDEYESGWGTAGGDLLSGVWSFCQATWISPLGSGTVSKGCTEGILF
jgi:hypothetical protein